MIWQELNKRFLAPKASDEDAARRELILDILLLGIIGLTVILFFITLAGSLSGRDYTGTPPIYQLIVMLFFVTLYGLSRAGFHKFVEYVFITVFLLFATLPIVQWGILLPQAILAYSLVIVMTGVLIGSRTAFFVAILMSVLLFVINHLEDAGVIVFNTDWMKSTGAYTDVIAYAITFIIIALVTWLSNREIERSLTRARISEGELLKERHLLERKVRERTKALESAHVEKMLDLQRFAEFGRLSSTLLHELANPLTAVALDLEQLEGKKRSKLISRAREGIAHMEQYVDSARRQLRNQSEIRLFNVAHEIERVAGFLEGKARTQHVRIVTELSDDVNIKGDSIRFDHIISNLLGNAIDAYDDVQTKKEKVVKIVMELHGQLVYITVTDHGCGIAKEQLPHIFDAFYTTKSTIQGTGIGLAITKQAIEEAFQGMVTVTSNEKQGTQFVVRLPLT